MKFVFILISIALLQSPSCHKENADSVPPCIQQKIAAIKAAPRWNPPAQVDKYLYNGKTVYLFSSNCCDQYNVLYNDACNYVCAPSGGFTGKGDGKCSDFFTKAKHMGIVWKDNR